MSNTGVIRFINLGIDDEATRKKDADNARLKAETEAEALRIRAENEARKQAENNTRNQAESQRAQRAEQAEKRRAQHAEDAKKKADEQKANDALLSGIDIAKVDPAKKTILMNIFTGKNPFTDTKNLFGKCTGKCGTINFTANTTETDITVDRNNLTVPVNLPLNRAQISSIIQKLTEKIKTNTQASVYILSITSDNGIAIFPKGTDNKKKKEHSFLLDILKELGKEFNLVRNTADTTITELIAKLQAIAQPEPNKVAVTSSSRATPAVLKAPHDGSPTNASAKVAKSAVTHGRLHAIHKAIPEHINQIIDLPGNSYVLIQFTGVDNIANTGIFDETKRVLYIPIYNKERDSVGKIIPFETKESIMSGKTKTMLTDETKASIDASLTKLSELIRENIDIFYVYSPVDTFKNIYLGAEDIRIDNAISNYISSGLGKLTPDYIDTQEALTKLIDSIKQANKPQNNITEISTPQQILLDIETKLVRDPTFTQGETDYIKNSKEEVAYYDEYMQNYNNHIQYSQEVVALFKTPADLKLHFTGNDEIIKLLDNASAKYTGQEIYLSTFILNFQKTTNPASHTVIDPATKFAKKCVLCLEFRKLNPDESKFTQELDGDGNPVLSKFCIDVTSFETFKNSASKLAHFICDPSYTGAYKYIYISFIDGKLDAPEAYDYAKLLNNIIINITATNTKNIIINDETNNSIDTVVKYLPKLYKKLEAYTACVQVLNDVITLFKSKFVTSANAQMILKLSKNMREMTDYTSNVNEQIKKFSTNLTLKIIDYINWLYQYMAGYQPQYFIYMLMEELIGAQQNKLVDTLKACDVYDRNIFFPDIYEQYYYMTVNTLNQLHAQFQVHDYYPKYTKQLYEPIYKELDGVLELIKLLKKESFSLYKKAQIIEPVYNNINAKINDIIPDDITHEHNQYELLKANILHGLQYKSKKQVPVLLKDKLEYKAEFLTKLPKLFSQLESNPENTADYWINLYAQLNTSYLQNLHNLRTKYHPIFVGIDTYTLDDVVKGLNDKFGQNNYTIEDIQNMGELLAIYDGNSVIANTDAMFSIFASQNIRTVYYETDYTKLFTLLIQYDIIIVTNDILNDETQVINAIRLDLESPKREDEDTKNVNAMINSQFELGNIPHRKNNVIPLIVNPNTDPSTNPQSRTGWTNMNNTNPRVVPLQIIAPTPPQTNTNKHVIPNHTPMPSSNPTNNNNYSRTKGNVMQNLKDIRNLRKLRAGPLYKPWQTQLQKMHQNLQNNRNKSKRRTKQSRSVPSPKKVM